MTVITQVPKRVLKGKSKQIKKPVRGRENMPSRKSWARTAHLQRNRRARSVETESLQTNALDTVTKINDCLQKAAENCGQIAAATRSLMELRAQAEQLQRENEELKLENRMLRDCLREAYKQPLFADTVSVTDVQAQKAKTRKSEKGSSPKQQPKR